MKIADCGLPPDGGGRRIADWKHSITIGCLLFLAFVRTALGADCLQDGRYVMGTVLQVTLCHAEAWQNQAAADQLFASATRLDQLLTTFSAESTISRLNAHAGRGPQAVPVEVATILSLSRQYWQLTHGSFDITVGPLMNVWRQAATTQALPSPVALQQARVRVGSDKLVLGSDGTVALARSGMVLDLGGIGKGYALDSVSAALTARGVVNALLDFGQSSMVALGHPPDARAGWRLLLRSPSGQTVGVVTLRDQSLSVSGNFGQDFVIRGQRYGHVLDPRIGQPLRRDLLACVLAPSAAQAEALSKALLVLGEREGIALLERLPGVEGLLHEGNGHRWMTAGWASATAFVPLSLGIERKMQPEIFTTSHKKEATEQQ